MTKLINPMVMNQIDSPEEREYLLLLYITDDSGESDNQIFEIITGREATYQYIKDMIDGMDINKSKVMVTDVTLKEALTIYQFMMVIKNKYYTNDTFDIDEYNV